MNKVAFIRKQPNGKYKIFSRKNKSLGEYNSLSEAEERLKRIEYFKHTESQDRRIQLLKLCLKEEPSYSAIMRDINDDKEKLELFMSVYKKTFDEALRENLENFDNIALLSAMKAIDYKV